MNVLVTGGAGFIGSHLVDGLVDAGHAVRILDSLDGQVHGPDAAWPAYLSAEVERLCGDIRDAAAVARALEGIEAVVHLASRVGVGQSMYEIESYVSVNDVGTAVLLEAIAARRGQVSRLVVASSMSIYGEGAYRDARGNLTFPRHRPDSQLAARIWELIGADGQPLVPVPVTETKPLHPTSVYAITKRNQEELALAFGLAHRIPAVALRYFNAYGSRQALSNPYTGVAAIFVSRLLNGKPPIVHEDGNQTRDFVHVSDVVQATMKALVCPADDGRVFNVGSGQPVTIRRLAEMLAHRLRVPIEPEIPGRFRSGDVRHCSADLTQARAELGFEPRVRLEEGIEELIEWARVRQAEDRVPEALAELSQRGLLH